MCWAEALVLCSTLNDLVGWPCAPVPRAAFRVFVARCSSVLVVVCHTQEGKEDRSAPIGVIGAGTGLGEVFMTPRGGDGVYEAWPSEGGHVEFAPRNELEFECLQFIKQKLGGRVSVERVVSGTGLVNVYEFLRSKFPEHIVARYDDEIMRETKEGGALIGKYSSEDKLCKQSMAFMLESYGAETGNLGLKFMPYGGLYIAGGIITKVLHHVNKKDSVFMKAFRDKGRLSTALYDVSAHALVPLCRAPSP